MSACSRAASPPCSYAPLRVNEMTGNSPYISVPRSARDGTRGLITVSPEPQFPLSGAGAPEGDLEGQPLPNPPYSPQPHLPLNNIERPAHACGPPPHLRPVLGPGRNHQLHSKPFVSILTIAGKVKNEDSRPPIRGMNQTENYVPSPTSGVHARAEASG